MKSPVAGSAWAGGRDAVHDAVALATEQLDGTRPELVVVFPDVSFPAAEVLAQARAAAPGARLAGMTSAGLITKTGTRYGGCSALAFGGGIGVGVGLGRHMSRDAVAAGRRATELALDRLQLEPGHGVVLLFVDPSWADTRGTVDGAYDVVGAHVPLAGGGANGGLPMVYADGAVARDAVVAVAVASPEPVAIGISHGCRPRPGTALVTKVDGRNVIELDGRPADDVYLESIGHAGHRLDDEAFEALAVLHPLAQPELRGEVRLRHVLGRASGGGLACATHIPPNAAIWFGEQTEGTIVSSASEAVTQMLEALRVPPRAALTFDCAARKRALGHRLDEEAASLMRAFGEPPPVAGLYTRGEVGRRRGSKGDLNHAVVVVGFG